MKKTFVVLTIAFVALFYNVIGSSPANATNYTWLKQKCETQGGHHTNLSGYSITTCITIGWRIQDDGTGLRAEDMWLDINNGCGDLEASPKVLSADLRIYAGDIGVDKTDEFPLGDFTYCHAYRDIELKGGDNIQIDAVRWNGQINVNNGGNYTEYVDMNICDNRSGSIIKC